MTASARMRFCSLFMAMAVAASVGYFVLQHGDFTLLSYPFKFPDSWSWLIDAANYAGHPVENPPVRPPIAPIVFSLLMRSEQADLIPWFGLAFHHLLTLVVFGLTARITRDPVAALIAGLLALTNASLLGNALYIGADVSANTTMLLAIYLFWCGADGNPRCFWLAAVTAVISALTQYAALGLAVPLLLFAMIARPRALASRHLWGSALLAALLLTAFGYWKHRTYGSAFYSNTAHGSLVRSLKPDALSAEWPMILDSVIRYAWGTLGYLSWPVALCIPLGIGAMLRQGRTGGLVLLIMTSVAFATFFSVCYSWFDTRFVQYWICPLMILAAIGLRSLLGEETQPATLAAPASRGSQPATSTRRIPLAALGMLAVAFCWNTLARSDPFADEVVAAPGVVLTLQSATTAEPPETTLRIAPHVSMRRHQPFGYAHMQALKLHRKDNVALACTFNDVVAEFQPLMITLTEQTGVDDPIAYQAATPDQWYWHGNALSLMTGRRVIAWNGPRNDAPLPALVVSSAGETINALNMRFVMSHGRMSVWSPIRQP